MRSNSPAAGGFAPGGGSSTRWDSTGTPAMVPMCFTSPWVGEIHRSTSSTMLPSAERPRNRTVSGNPGRGAGPTGCRSTLDHCWVGKAKKVACIGLKARAAALSRSSRSPGHIRAPEGTSRARGGPSLKVSLSLPGSLGDQSPSPCWGSWDMVTVQVKCMEPSGRFRASWRTSNWMVTPMRSRRVVSTLSMRTPRASAVRRSVASPAS